VIEFHLLRHADAGDPEAWTGPDEVRPLSGKGKKQADRLGKFLAGVGFKPDAIISSPKVRARQTAEIVADHLGVAVALDDRLAVGFDVGTVEAILREAGDPVRPVLVGHDPDFSEMVETLTGLPGMEMKKGAIVRIDVERPLADGAGRLAWLVPPDLLKPRTGDGGAG
jgi:phosphohistidine phosphatase